jgi:hypothetical protein
LNISTGDVLNATFPLRYDTVQIDGKSVPFLDQDNPMDSQMYCFSFNISWGLNFNPPVGQTYVAFIQPGVTQLKFFFSDTWHFSS